MRISQNSVVLKAGSGTSEGRARKPTLEKDSPLGQELHAPRADSHLCPPACVYFVSTLLPRGSGEQMRSAAFVCDRPHPPTAPSLPAARGLTHSSWQFSWSCKHTSWAVRKGPTPSQTRLAGWPVRWRILSAERKQKWCWEWAQCLPYKPRCPEPL